MSVSTPDDLKIAGVRVKEAAIALLFDADVALIPSSAQLKHVHLMQQDGHQPLTAK